MYFALWLVLGVVLASPLLFFASKLKLREMNHLMGTSLIAAAVIYIGFAFVWGNGQWIGLEFLGVFLYGFFYGMSLKHSVLWVALGWLFHPVWDLGVHLYGPGSHVVPEWYAVACFSFDLAAASYIFYRAKHAEKRETAQESS